MPKRLFITLTLLISSELFSLSHPIQLTSKSNYTRLSIKSHQSSLKIRKDGDVVYFESLEGNLIKSLCKTIKESKKLLKLVSNVNCKITASDVGKISLHLKSSSTELFDFYRQSKGTHVVDFWAQKDNEDKVRVGLSAVSKKKVEKKSSSLKIVKPIKVSAKKIASKQKDFSDITVKLKSAYKGIRDFRYGASFVWNNDPAMPELKKRIELNSKTPEYFYPVKDRKFEKNDKEAHLQLMINLYRKKKYGLMYKSMKLFEEKYGENDSIDFIEYLKANAILSENLKDRSSGPAKMAVNMFVGLAQRAKDYDYRKSVLKYLVEYYVDQKETIKALEFAKKLYVFSKENYDIEESAVMVEVILHQLSKLNQLEKIEEIANDKTIVKIVAPQVLLSYQIYVALKLNDDERVISLYKKNKKSLVGPIKPTILYNIGEAYFRSADYKTSIKLFDTYLSVNSHRLEAPFARVRLALMYELMEDKPSKILSLYKDAINKSGSFKASLEAKVRYVAFKNLRVVNISNEAKEERVFITLKDYEKSKVDKNLKKLLWLVRLRMFIVDEQYSKALSYLNAIPLNSLLPSDMRVFEADGAEVVYGVIRNWYESGDYSKVVQVWELYKNDYVSKVATDSYVNFVVADSFLRLGLYSGFEKMLARLDHSTGTPEKTFPSWIDRTKFSERNFYRDEIRLLAAFKRERLEEAELLVNKMSKTYKNTKLSYYKAIILFKEKKYLDAIKESEKCLAADGKSSLYTDSEVVSLMTAYVESIYNEGDSEKLFKVSSAILSDLKGDSVEIKSLKERVNYLKIELMSSDKNLKNMIGMEIERFLVSFPKSMYTGRLGYLLGSHYANGAMKEKGEKILSDLIKSSNVEEHIKEMARSELSLIKLKNREI